MGLIEPQHSFEGVLSMANGNRSIENGQVANAGSEALPAMTVVGELSASPGTYTQYNNAGAGGAEQAAGVALYETKPSAGTEPNVILKRDAEVKRSSLQFAAGTSQGDIDAAVADLEALGIEVR